MDLYYKMLIDQNYNLDNGTGTNNMQIIKFKENGLKVSTDCLTLIIEHTTLYIFS